MRFNILYQIYKSNYLLFIIYYLLFIIYYLLFIIYYLLFIIYYLLFIIYYLLFIIYYFIIHFNMSLPYFDNTVSIDVTNLDIKTQNQTATSTDTTFNKDVVFDADIIGSKDNNKIELNKTIDVNVVTTGTLKVNGANVGTSADINNLQTTLDTKMGSVAAPVVANSVPIFDSTGGKLLKESLMTLDSNELKISQNPTINFKQQELQAGIVDQVGHSGPLFDASYGWKFTVAVEDISVIRFKIAIDQWKSTDTTKEIAMYDASDQSLLSAGIISMTKTNSDGFYYYYDLPTPITLTLGSTYAIVAFYKVADGNHYYVNSYPPEITNIVGLRSNTGQTSLEYPPVDDLEWLMLGMFDFKRTINVNMGLSISGDLEVGDTESKTTISNNGIRTLGAIVAKYPIATQGHIDCTNLYNKGFITCTSITASGDISGVDVTASGNIESAAYTQGGNNGEIVKIFDTTNFYANGRIDSNDTGNNNTFMGFSSGTNMTSGQRNAGFGSSALANISTGSYNTSVGAFTLVNYNGTNNSIVGGMALSLGSGDNNVVMGKSAGFAMLLSDNNAIIGSLSTSTTNDVRTECVALGYGTNVVGSNAIAIGANAESKVNNECVIGDANLLSISNMGTGTCDLGTSANKFKDGHFGGNVNCATMISGSVISTGDIETTKNVLSSQNIFCSGQMVADNITVNTVKNNHWVLDLTLDSVDLHHRTGVNIDRTTTLMTLTGVNTTTYRVNTPTATPVTILEDQWLKLEYSGIDRDIIMTMKQSPSHGSSIYITKYVYRTSSMSLEDIHTIGSALIVAQNIGEFSGDMEDLVFMPDGWDQASGMPHYKLSFFYTTNNMNIMVYITK
jgi:hypothetical protein